MNTPSTFKCLGKVYNCTTDSPADPDIVGIGIMAAFFATSVATFTTIFVGYFKSYLPEIVLNDVDRLLLRITRRETTKSQVKLKTRRQGVEAFILSLSDQQLATGLAILVAGFVKCDISVYSFRNVSAIAWFSCTTHLATLTILKRHLRKHKYVLTLRVVGMVFIGGLLITSNFMSTIANATVKAWRRKQRLEEGLDICFYCILGSSEKTLGYFWMDLVSTLWLLVWAYPVRIFALYSPEQKMRSLQDGYSIHLYGLREMPPDDHYNLIRRIHQSCDDKAGEFRKRLFSGVYFAWFAYLEIRRSYWWEIIWLLFAGAFSLSKVLIVWLSYSDISGSRVLAEASTEMGFGQMAALLLLVVPCLAALEAFKAGSETTKPMSNEVKKEDVQMQTDSQPYTKPDPSPDIQPGPALGPAPSPVTQNKESITSKTDSLNTKSEIPKATIEKVDMELLTDREKERRNILLQPGNDPYDFDLYRYILAILLIVYSVYIIGIGVTMALAPNIQSFAYASVPFILEASVRMKEIFVFCKRTYRNWRRKRADRKPREESRRQHHLQTHFHRRTHTQENFRTQASVVRGYSYNTRPTETYSPRQQTEVYSPMRNLATTVPQTLQLAHY